MRILKSIILAGLLVGAPAAAQTGGTVSEAGKKIVTEHFSKRSAEIEPLLQRKRALQAQFDALLTPAKYDEAALQAKMGEMKVVEGQIFDAMGATMLSLLKALPANDRAIFMKSLTKTPPAAAGR